MQFWILCFATLFTACFETIALGCVAFFASVVTDPETVLQSRYILTAHKILNADFLTNKQGLVVSLSILVVSLVIVKNVMLSFVLFWSSRFAAFVDGFFGEMMLRNFILRHYEWHLYQNSADLIMAVDWRRYFGVHFIYPVLQMFADGFVAVLMLIILFWVEPYISLVTITVLGGTAFFILVTVRETLDKNTKICSDYQQSVNRQVTKSIHGVKDVKVFGKQDFFISNYSKEVYDLARREAFRQFFTRTPSWALEILGFLMITGSICVMMFLMSSSTVQITGTIALIAVTAWRVLPAVSRIVSGATSLRTALPYVHNAFTYLKEDKRDENKILNKSKMNHRRVSFEREIKFENLSFSYTGANSFALQNINFSIKKGQTVGIIGPSGAGKSTLVDIFIGLLPPTRGKVLIDDESLDMKSSSGWMDLLGYVSQTPYIYDGSLAENVAFGVDNGGIDSNRVSDCCSMAAMDFLKDLPHGIDTQIGERGLRLSGGQRQRVAIARALYHQPQVMVFDEATSALDAKNEMDIQKTIYSLKGSLTLIIIAHRLTSVKDCDLLFCIQKGELVKSGPPHMVLPWYADNVTAVAEPEKANPPLD
jgi:ATP-binding cassette, subfamily B, bacterial PglK